MASYPPPPATIQVVYDNREYTIQLPSPVSYSHSIQLIQHKLFSNSIESDKNSLEISGLNYIDNEMSEIKVNSDTELLTAIKEYNKFYVEVKDNLKNSSNLSKDIETQAKGESCSDESSQREAAMYTKLDASSSRGSEELNKNSSPAVDESIYSIDRNIDRHVTYLKQFCQQSNLSAHANNLQNKAAQLKEKIQSQHFLAAMREKSNRAHAVIVEGLATLTIQRIRCNIVKYVIATVLLVLLVSVASSFKHSSHYRHHDYHSTKLINELHARLRENEHSLQFLTNQYKQLSNQFVQLHNDQATRLLLMEKQLAQMKDEISASISRQRKESVAGSSSFDWLEGFESNVNHLLSSSTAMIEKQANSVAEMFDDLAPRALPRQAKKAWKKALNLWKL
jgi:hypothetical protein